MALWEEELTMMSFFQLLRFRPLAESPIVAMKALITLMKVWRLTLSSRQGAGRGLEENHRDAMFCTCCSIKGS